MKEYINNEINIIKSKGLYRGLKNIETKQGRIIKIDDNNYLNFSSNNYLGLADNAEIQKTIKESLTKWGNGAGASRLISGNQKVYSDLENKLAELKERENSLIYPTGYMTNVGIISALSGDNDALIIDRLNHASIIDGTKISGARRFVYKHCDMNSLAKVLKRTAKYKKRFVITDTIFSMDGDAPPLKDITELCKKYNANLIVDEAHAFGVFGKNGSGLMSEYNLAGETLIDMGTFSKAAGSLGGYAACDNIVREYLINTSRSLIYTTALPPYLVEANIAALELIKKADKLRNHLKSLSKTLRKKLSELGFEIGNSISQIIPVIIGENEDVISLSKYLYNKGMYVPAIRFPTVPKGTARLRISLTAEHTEKDVEVLTELLKDY